MAFNVRHPVWLPVAPAPGVATFATLYFVETLARAVLSSVVPIQALELFGDGARVSFLYSAIAVGALLFGLLVPVLIRAFARRRVFTLGAILLILGAAAFATVTTGGQIAGMILRVSGAAALSITVNLYILDHIGRHDFVRNDAMRLGFSTLGWTLAPYGGVWLYQSFGPWAAFGASGAAALVLLALFWYYRMSENTVIVAGRTAPAHPVRNVRRFAAQPRLRLAWSIAFARSAFWSTFFIYGPILMVTAGYSRDWGGLIVSGGNALLITIFFWGRLAARRGVRPIATFSFLAAAASLVPAGLAGSAEPLVCAGFLLLATLFIIPLDAVGGVPFYRSVRPFERAAMTSVYRTYIDMAELLPTLVYGMLLQVFGLGAVFLALAVLLGVAGLVCLRHIPRGL